MESATFPKTCYHCETGSCILCGMTLADDILSLVTRKPGLTEAEIAKHLFGRLGYQQRVNSTCRRLIREDRVERRGNGGPGHPFSYHERIVNRA